MKKLAIVLLLASVACGSKSPTAPSTPAVTTPTRIINLSGAMDFGNIQVGQSFSATLNVRNSGNAPLTLTSISGSTSFINTLKSNGASGVIAPGASHDILVTFTPPLAQAYSGLLTVNGDQTSGTNTIQFSGTGTLTGLPVFSKSGTGDTVFDMPTYVSRIRVTGTYTGFSSNFIVKVGGALLVNELLGTAWPITRYDGTLLTTGGVVAITNSSGVAWTFTEVR